MCWWMSGGWRGGWWAIGGGPAPAKRDFDGGKNDSKAKNRNVTVVLLRQITVSQKSNHAGTYHPCTRLV